jgi:hypothetical protein
VSWRAEELETKTSRNLGRGVHIAPLMLCVLLGALCLPAAASWSGGTVTLQPSTSVVRPGDSLSVVWSRLPEETEEFELLLCCESPAVQSFRLTDQLDPSLGIYTWHVPDVPCDSARLKIRAGIEGRGETTWAISAPFRIAWEPTGPVQKVTVREGELWMSEELGRPVSSVESNQPMSLDPISSPPAGAEAPQSPGPSQTQSTTGFLLDGTEQRVFAHQAWHRLSVGRRTVQLRI